MSAHCHHDSHGPGDLNANNPRYRRILWWALIINAAMFAIEIAAGVQSGSVSLLADAIDFLGDAANYGVSLMVLGMTLAWRARAALLKGASMLLFGLFVAGRALWAVAYGTPPEAITMGLVGLLALAANVGVAIAATSSRRCTNRPMPPRPRANGRRRPSGMCEPVFEAVCGPVPQVLSSWPRALSIHSCRLSSSPSRLNEQLSSLNRALDSRRSSRSSSTWP